MSVENLWPNFEENGTRNPKTILEEQATLLKERTNGKLFARVTQANSSNRISLNFQIIAPTVGNYIFSLFMIQHNIEVYPITFMYNQTGTSLENEEALVQKMREVFNNEETKKRISTLMSY